jgi:UDP-N-acetylmuramoylalanine--D-glutamate ligase
VSKRILIIGLGKSGAAATELAIEKGYITIAVDENISAELEERKKKLDKKGASVILSYKEKQLPDCNLIVLSPGILADSELWKMLLSAKVPIISEIEFAYRYCKCSIIAITGTNGKTTVTELCTYMLKKAGKKVMSAGNIGYPFSSLVLKNPDLDFVILELSSFQLSNIETFTPYAAALLNIGSDHIDWHGTKENYTAAKFNMFNNMKNTSNIILNRNLLSEWKKYFPGAKTRPLNYSISSRNSDYYFESPFIYKHADAIFSVENISLSGLHNIENVIVSIGLCEICGIKLDEMFELIKDFKTGAHRLELVADKGGIKYINDSKSTNPDALIAALRAVGGKKNICLIAGGLDKKMDFLSVLEEEKKIKKIFLVGKCKNKLAKVWGTMLDYESCNSFKEAINSAYFYAEPGDVVLLSPACASMDMFSNYIERGIFFKKIINRRLCK